MSRKPGVVLGYHGCDAAVGEKILAGDAIEASEKTWDWLGKGAYFWEDDPDRALEWAHARREMGKITTPAVIGAVIDLGNCLDLTTRANLTLLRDSYDGLAKAFKALGKDLPENRDAPNAPAGNMLLRDLDNAVIEHLHETIQDVPDFESFDTVRGLFIEGDPLYPGGSFFSHTHSQLCVRNLANVRGYFRPIS